MNSEVKEIFESILGETTKDTDYCDDCEGNKLEFICDKCMASCSPHEDGEDWVCSTCNADISWLSCFCDVNRASYYSTKESLESIKEGERLSDERYYLIRSRKDGKPVSNDIEIHGYPHWGNRQCPKDMFKLYIYHDIAPALGWLKNSRDFNYTIRKTSASAHAIENTTDPEVRTYRVSSWGWVY